jgi:hypothetical protein
MTASQPGTVVTRGATELTAWTHAYDTLPWKDRGETREEQNRQDQGEESGLAVAEKCIFWSSPVFFIHPTPHTFIAYVFAIAYAFSALGDGDNG